MYKRQTLKIAGVVLCAVAFCALMHMLMPNAPEEIKDVYTYCKTNRIGGGLLGGIVAILLKKAVGTVGTYLVLLGILIICVVIITGLSLIHIFAQSELGVICSEYYFAACSKICRV